MMNPKVIKGEEAVPGDVIMVELSDGRIIFSVVKDDIIWGNCFFHGENVFLMRQSDFITITRIFTKEEYEGMKTDAAGS